MVFCSAPEEPEPEEPQLAALQASSSLCVAGPSQDLAQKGWPVIFKLPNFPLSLQKDLETKNPLFHSSRKSKARNDLVRSLVDAISIHTW